MDQIYEDIIEEMNEEELLAEYSELKRFRSIESQRGQVSPAIISQIELVQKELKIRSNISSHPL